MIQTHTHTLSLCLSTVPSHLSHIWCQAVTREPPCVCLMVTWCPTHWTLWRNLISHAATLCSASFHAVCLHAFMFKHSSTKVRRAAIESCFFYFNFSLCWFFTAISFHWLLLNWFIYCCLLWPTGSHVFVLVIYQISQLIMWITYFFLIPVISCLFLTNNPILLAAFRH